MKFQWKDILILSMFAILALMILFKSNCNSNVKPVTTSVKTEIKYVDRIIEKSNRLSDSIISENKKLKQSVVEITKSIKYYQSESENLRWKIYHDTIYTARTPEDLAASSYFSDSLCNEAIEMQNNQILNLEKVVFVKDTTINSLSERFRKVTDNQLACEKYSKSLEKTISKKNRAKLGWKLVAIAGGAVILISSLK